ncbi:DUF1759 domain-containing protein, partial [Klebsiella pneumoniae]|uniref:DUF1759 domain-containing protein n=1 Tax=Klebsiella pneumoniae TaxID=573 RepID=UPI0040557D90
MRIQRKRNPQPYSLSNESTLNSSVFNSNKPQLPRIPIPTFSGDILKWTHFRDTFLSLVHGDHNLSNVEKFHY